MKLINIIFLTFLTIFLSGCADIDSGDLALSLTAWFPQDNSSVYYNGTAYYNGFEVCNTNSCAANFSVYVNTSALTQDVFPVASGTTTIKDSGLNRDYLEAGGLVFTNELIYNHSFFSNNNQRLFSLQSKTGVDFIKFVTNGAGTTQIQFNDQENSYVGADPSFTNYFSFGNDVGNFWLPIASDPLLYFNYLLGNGEVHGTSANYQTFSYYTAAARFFGQYGTAMTIIPPTANYRMWEFNFGASAGRGMRISDNKGIYFGTNQTGDASIIWDSSDLQINTNVSGQNGDAIFSNGIIVPTNSTFGSSTNNLKVYDNGKVSMVGTAKTKQHLMIPLEYVGKGATKLTEVVVGNYNTWEYQINDEAVFDIELPHNLDTTENTSIHISWVVPETYATNSGEVQWQLNYSLTPHDETESLLNPTNSGGIVTGDINIPTIAYGLKHTTSFVIPASEIGDNHDIMGVTLKRITIDGGNNPSGTNYPQLVGLHLEYLSDKLGTY